MKINEEVKNKLKEEFTLKCIQTFGRDPKKLDAHSQFNILGDIIRDKANVNAKDWKKKIYSNHKKQLIYFSMEFLVGKMMTLNLYNLGILEEVKVALKELGINYSSLEEAEPDPGLGNGGLGRLAACYLDSGSSIGIPFHGNCIRYEYGFFKQKIRHGRQEEYPDPWLIRPYPFETCKPSQAITVRFYGNAIAYQDEKTKETKWKTENAYSVLSIPYDLPVIGYKNKVVNSLRLWYAEPCVDEKLPKNSDFNSYLQFIRELTHGLYPDDSTEEGKLLRLKQQYFLISSGIQFTCKREIEEYGTLDHLSDHYVFQLNDTHPIMAIPELMRILLDEHNYSWDKAFNIVKKCFAFTNHTVMPEALEKWPCRYISSLAPRIYMIIEEIDRRVLKLMREKGLSEEEISNNLIIKDGNVNMCQLAIHISYSVNGVAALHTNILKKQTFKHLYKMYPKKFSNKTNGISHRRFLLISNPSLTNYLTSLIGTGFLSDANELIKLDKYTTNEKKNFKVFEEINNIKHQNKVEFSNFIKKTYDIDISPDFIFDTQIKRLHAYKRQLMNILRIIHLYFRMKEDSSFRIKPTLYIFGAKAAPSYVFAKKIIELILAVAKVINNDPQISKFMKVLFVENYSVSLAQRIIPASEISEQISLAGKEASGTSNMKFMMNGAITLGTLDGANVEISNLVGKENAVIFGLKEDEVNKIKFEGSYSSLNLYQSNSRIKKILDTLIDGTFSNDKDKFRIIYDELIYKNDEFMVLNDFESYVSASKKIEELYTDRINWGKMSLVNIAKSGYFSSDRSVNEYNDDIWHLEKIHQK